jgi:ATP sulfurylase
MVRELRGDEKPITGREHASHGEFPYKREYEAQEALLDPDDVDREWDTQQTQLGDDIFEEGDIDDDE